MRMSRDAIKVGNARDTPMGDIRTVDVTRLQVLSHIFSSGECQVKAALETCILLTCGDAREDAHKVPQDKSKCVVEGSVPPMEALHPVNH